MEKKRPLLPFAKGRNNNPFSAVSVNTDQAMTISYGSVKDKYCISIIYLLSAIMGAAILIRDQMFYQPYIRLPLFLLLCSTLFVLFPLKKLDEAFIWERLYRILPVVLFGGFIYWTSSLTLSSGQAISPPDYLLHSGQFFILGLFSARMAVANPDRHQKQRLLYLFGAFAFVIVFGGLDEIHQRYVPSRDPSIKDFFVDAIGGLAGLVSYHLLSRRQE